MNIVKGLQFTPLAAIFEIFSFSIYYSFFTFPFLIALNRYGVNTVFALVLAGSLYGWGAETVVVPAAYEAIPISYFWTSISWHVLIDVLFGWYALRLIMRHKNIVWNALMFIVLGVFWAYWGTWYWGGEFAAIPPEDFLMFAFVTSIIWTVGMFLADTFGRVSYTPTKWEIGVIGLMVLAMFTITALPYFPLSLSILPLFALTVFALHKSRGKQNKRLILGRLHETRPVWWKYPLTMLTPISAYLLYTWLYDTQTKIPTDDATFVLLLIGVVLFFLAVFKAFRPQTSS